MCIRDSRISSGIGVVKPYDIGGMLMKPIFDQGKKDSFVNKGVNFLAKQNNKVSFLPKAGADPKTDLGKKLGDKIGSIFKTKPNNSGSRSRFK